MNRDAHLTLRISAERKKALEEMAARMDVSTGQLVRRAIDHVLQDRVAEEVTVYSVTDAPPRSADPFRTREQDWIDSHREQLEAYRGEWIVVEGDRLVAHSPDAATAFAEARRQGIQVPFVEWIPPMRREGFWMGL